jgi:hypothetical protein
MLIDNLPDEARKSLENVLFTAVVQRLKGKGFSGEDTFSLARDILVEVKARWSDIAKGADEVASMVAKNGGSAADVSGNVAVYFAIKGVEIADRLHEQVNN